MKKNDNMIFTKKDTNICKGVAILFMILHHGCNRYYNVPNLQWYVKTHIETGFPYFLIFLSTAGKVCVPLLTILSGYGLTKKYMKERKENNIVSNIKFVLSCLLKLQSIYIPVYIVMLILNIGQLPTIYSTNGTSDLSIVTYVILDVLNISRFISTKVLVKDWYIRAIIIMYILFPFFYKLVKKIGILSLPLSFIPFVTFLLINNTVGLYDISLFYFPSFFIGIIFAKYNTLDTLKMKINNKRIALSAILLVVFFVLRIIFSYHIDNLLAISIITFEANVLSQTKKISKILNVIGINSANMWLLHSYVLNHSSSISLLYKYVPVVMFTLFISIIIDQLKKFLGWEKIINNIKEFLI